MTAAPWEVSNGGVWADVAGWITTDSDSEEIRKQGPAKPRSRSSPASASQASTPSSTGRNA